MPVPTARWDFEDCSSQRTELRDSAFQGFTAYRSINVRCVEGAEGQGVTLPNRKDLVYVPDQPAFVFNEGVTVAAWVKPSNLRGTHTIFRKRDGGTSSFVLMIVNNSYTFVIDREGRRAASVSAPAKGKDWTHVAGTYDGQVLRLYVGGREVASTKARGVIAPGEGPVLIGNDADRRRFEGTLDSPWLATRAVDADTILGLTCRQQPPSLTARPSSHGPVAPGTPVTYELIAKNNNLAACGPASYFFQQQNFVEDFSIFPSFEFLTLGSGETRTIPVTVTSGFDVEPGTFSFQFAVVDTDRFGATDVLVDYIVDASGCRVSPRKELMIRDVSVVDDRLRTTVGATTDRRDGAWTFARLMEQLAPGPEDAPAVVERLFGSFTTTQTINGFEIQPRLGMEPLVLARWPRKDGQLDLTRAPMRLLAIVNRMDLRNLSEGNAGEGRFVFGVTDDSGFPLEFTIILEYKLPARTEADVLAWAQAWHHLSELPFPSEAYNAALQGLTDRFTRRGVMPGRPLGSALTALRTNEISLDNIWELREFTLNAAGELAPTPVTLTPDRSFDGSAQLADWVNANEAAVLRETHQVPLSLGGAPFLGGSVMNVLEGWRGDGITNPEARHKFSMNTCNGCHSAQETGTFFLHIGNRFPGQESFLSSFLTGVTTFDLRTGEPRFLNDLARRNRDLAALVCPPDQVPPPPVGGGPIGTRADVGVATRAPKPSVSKGIDRVH